MLGGVMEKVLIGGCGITGSATAAFLGKHLPERCKLAVWEKARGKGGRMSTSRNPNDERSTVDLGAQYISTEPQDYASHKVIYDELESAGVLRQFAGVIENDRQYAAGTKHYVAPAGVSSLAKHFIQKAGTGVDVLQQHRISSVSEQSGRWHVTAENGHSDFYDCVLLTFPAAQILQLQGSIKQIIENQPEVKTKMEKVVFSSRYAIGLFYEPGTTIDVPWSAKYIPGDEVLCFAAIDDKKRGIESKEIGPSVIAHTSVPFGLAHLEENKDAVCSNIVLPRLRHIMPELPPGGTVLNHKWRYSQVFKAYEGTPGFIILQEKPLLICAGDSFTGSKFDNCLHSAKKTVEALLRYSQTTSGL